jgi:hypothetical protein
MSGQYENWSFRDRAWGCTMDSSRWRGPVTGSSEDCNKLSCCINGEKCLDPLRYHQLHMKWAYSAPWSSHTFSLCMIFMHNHVYFLLSVFFRTERVAQPQGVQIMLSIHLLQLSAHSSSSHLHIRAFAGHHLVHSASKQHVCRDLWINTDKREGRKVERPHRTYVYYPLTRSAHILVLTDRVSWA